MLLQWKSLGYCTGINITIHNVSQHKPQDLKKITLSIQSYRPHLFSHVNPVTFSWYVGDNLGNNIIGQITHLYQRINVCTSKKKNTTYTFLLLMPCPVDFHCKRITVMCCLFWLRSTERGERTEDSNEKLCAAAWPSDEGNANISCPERREELMLRMIKGQGLYLTANDVHPPVQQLPVSGFKTHVVQLCVQCCQIEQTEFTKFTFG